MPLNRTTKFLSITALCVSLAACKSAEEQAQEYYEEAIALAEAGDNKRAIVQLRNVFQLDAGNRDARVLMAELQLEEGNFRNAYRQLLRVAEQFPDDIDTRLLLSELAFDARQWDEFQRHGSVVIESGVDSPRKEAVALAMQYQTAVQNDELTALEGIFERAEALNTTDSENKLLIGIIVDGAARAGDYDKALAFIDKLTADSPEDRGLAEQRLGLLVIQGDEAGTELQLKSMVETFPEDTNLKGNLVQYYTSRGETDKAEAFLREQSDPSAEDIGLFFDLVQFISQTRGIDAAREELVAAIDVSPEPLELRALVAGIDFETGQRDEAIATMEGLVADQEASEKVNQVKVGLANMLIETGNDVGARAQVAEVLEDDPANVEALKMQAAWQIEADDTDAAIAGLRVALDNASDDATAMTLMAHAYDRAGSKSLARDFLSLAVEASGNAPAESLRYANVLLGEERYLPAEDILISSLRIYPNNIEVLSMLGRVYIEMGDDPRVTQVIATLRRNEATEAQQAANTLEVAQINASSGPEEAVAYLEELAGRADGEIGPQLMLIRAQLATGETTNALAQIDLLSEEFPDNPEIDALRAVVLHADGQLDEATRVYRTILDEYPEADLLWIRLSQVVAANGEPDEAYSVVEEGLEALPDSPNLLWAKASFLEKQGAFEETIGIYESLYERFSDNIVIANNLASMLSTYRTDEESLERAWLIARRLTDVDQPAFQDTYGWILHRRGESSEAVAYLEPAADGLPRDPIAQFHLGSAYAALGRTDEAITRLQRAIDIAGPADTRPQIQLAKEEIARLRESAPE